MDAYFKRLYNQYADDTKENLRSQLIQIREDKHRKYIVERSDELHDDANNNNNNNYNNNNNNTDKKSVRNKWPPNTIFLTGDSMFKQIDEKRLCNSTKRNVKVRSFPGATSEKMYQNIAPLLLKEPKFIILHIGTKDCVNKSSDTIVDEILKLKHHIEVQLPGVIVIISSPITRTDNAKARLTIKHIINKIKLLKVNYLLNDNIYDDYLGQKGLHLNQRGTGRMAVNFA